MFLYFSDRYYLNARQTRKEKHDKHSKSKGTGVFDKARNLSCWSYCLFECDLPWKDTPAETSNRATNLWVEEVMLMGVKFLSDMDYTMGRVDFRILWSLAVLAGVIADMNHQQIKGGDGLGLAHRTASYRLCVH